jgi:hypothetical protein
LDHLKHRGYFQRTYCRDNDSEYPFLLGDQDLLNAILATQVDPERVVELESRLEAVPPFPGLRVLDERALKCAYQDGTEPYVLHHFLSKPWWEPTVSGVYTQLLVRLLRGSDVAVRVPEREFPLHLRPGLLAAAERWCRGPLSERARALRDRVARVREPTGG